MQCDVEALELEDDERYMQMYSTELIDSDFRILDFPRDSEDEQTRLKELGIFFLRDACDHQPIFGENMTEPIQCWYTQIILERDGTIDHDRLIEKPDDDKIYSCFVVHNRPCLVEWIDGGRVKRKFLD